MYHLTWSQLDQANFILIFYANMEPISFCLGESEHVDSSLK